MTRSVRRCATLRDNTLDGSVGLAVKAAAVSEANFEESLGFPTSLLSTRYDKSSANGEPKYEGGKRRYAHARTFACIGVKTRVTSSDHFTKSR